MEGYVGFQEGQAFGVITLRPLQDGIPEFTETYYLTILNVTGWFVCEGFYPLSQILLKINNATLHFQSAQGIIFWETSLVSCSF